MLEKHINLGGVDSQGNPRFQLLFPSSKEKTASEMAKTANLHPAVLKFKERVRPTPKGVYILVNALGATEYWGQNRNGDRVYEPDLNYAPQDWDELTPEEMAPIGKAWPYGYPTFFNAHFYFRHRNKDPRKSSGDVVVAVWNKKMKRVDLVLYIDRARSAANDASDFINAIDAGQFPDVSMGLRVKADRCSACGHWSETQATYCDHIKNHLGEILPNGIQIGMENPRPRFFDISGVVRGADRTAKMLLKIAEERGAKTAQQKRGELKKYIGNMGSHAEMEHHEKPLSRDLLDELAQRPLQSALSSTGMAGIVLRPREFQRIILIQIGKRNLADDLDEEGACFPETDDIEPMGDVVHPNHVDEHLLHLLAGHGAIADRSVAAPAIRRRLIIAYRRPVEENGDRAALFPFMNKLAASYNGYRAALLSKVASMNYFLSSHPVLVSEIYGDPIISAFNGGMAKTASRTLSPESLTYLLGAFYNDRTKLAGTAECRAVQALLG